MVFFDKVTGMPKIWYSSRSDGTLNLFDGCDSTLWGVL